MSGRGAAPRQSLAANLALAVGVSLLLLGGLEVLARAFEERRPTRPVASYIWDWQEKWSGDFYTVGSGAAGWPPWEEFNGDGVRDRTHSPAKPPGFRRLVFLGDSVTLGAGLEARQAYPQLLQERLDDAGRRVEVFNVALWGWSTRQEAIAYRRIARRYAPDRVVVAVCLNDIPELQNNLTRPAAWLAWLHRRSALVRRLVDAQGREIQSVEDLFAQPDSPRVRQGFERFFVELRGLRAQAAGNGASLALLVFPFRFQLAPDAPEPSAQRRIAAFCASEGIPMLDMLPALQEAGEAAFLDYDHLSAKGARLTAQAILASPLLPQAAAEPELLARRFGTGPPDPLAALGDPDADVRAAAAWTLGRGQAGEREISALQAGLGDASPLVALRCAEALGRLRARAAVPALYTALADPREAPRWAAAQALWRIGTQAPDDLDALVGALRNPDPYVRAFGAWSLGELGPVARDTVPALVEALRLEEGEQGAAARALAKLGPVAVEAVPALLEQLGSPEARRRFTAAEALGRIGPEARASIDPLVAGLRDEDDTVRSSCAQALGRIGPSARAAVPALIGVLRSDADAHSRALAARALGQIGPAARDAVAALNAAAQDPDAGVRREVAKALPRIYER